jgi:hypothetical protein
MHDQTVYRRWRLSDQFDSIRSYSIPPSVPSVPVFIITGLDRAGFWFYLFPVPSGATRGFIKKAERLGTSRGIRNVSSDTRKSIIDIEVEDDGMVTDYNAD